MLDESRRFKGGIHIKGGNNPPRYCSKNMFFNICYETFAVSFRALALKKEWRFRFAFSLLFIIYYSINNPANSMRGVLSVHFGLSGHAYICILFMKLLL